MSSVQNHFCSSIIITIFGIISIMSGLEARCVQFHEAALGTGKSKGATKEIATLRKFLHKNQTQRFTDKAAARLLDTIGIYVAQDPNEEEDDVREGLLEDALKMPFTVFSTKQKAKMLKWMGDRRGGVTTNNGAPAGILADAAVLLTVMDVNDSNVSLMNAATGDTYEHVTILDTALFQSIQQTFEATQDAIDVRATVQDEVVTVVELAPSS